MGAYRFLLQVRGCLMVASTTHGRCRIPPARNCPARQPHFLVGAAEVVEGPALTVPVASLPEDRYCIAAGADRLFEPPHLLQRDNEVV
jgi:hypothetical protein